MGIFLRLNGCCCGCTLKTGSLIIGWLQLISMFMVMIAMAALLAEIDPNAVDDQAAKDAIMLTRVFLISMIVTSAIFLIPSLVLLIGIYKDRPKLVKGWVYFNLVMVIIEISYEAIIIIYLLSNGVFLMAFYELLRAVIYTLISWYFMSVVHSYYTESVNGMIDNPSVVKFT